MNDSFFSFAAQEQQLADLLGTQLQSDPLNVSVRLARARLLYKLGRNADALADVDALVEQQAVSSYKSLAALLLQYGETARACTLIDAYLDASADDAEAYLLRGRLRRMLHDDAGAFDDLRRALAADPSLVNALSGQFSVGEEKKPFQI